MHNPFIFANPPIPHFIVGVTGHRHLQHKPESIKAALKTKLIELAPTKVLIGMALGFDQLVAELCIEMKIPFVAAIPFKEQDRVWPNKDKQHYKELLEKASEIVTVSEGPYQTWMFHKRNAWIVDRSNILISYMLEEKGGTVSCAKYALSKKIPIWNLPKEVVLEDQTT